MSSQKLKTKTPKMILSRERSTVIASCKLLFFPDCGPVKNGLVLKFASLKKKIVDSAHFLVITSGFAHLNSKLKFL